LHARTASNRAKTVHSCVLHRPRVDEGSRSPQAIIIGKNVAYITLLYYQPNFDYTSLWSDHCDEIDYAM